MKKLRLLSVILAVSIMMTSYVGAVETNISEDNSELPLDMQYYL